MKHKHDDVPEMKEPNVDDLHRTLVACRRALKEGYPTVLVAPSIVLWLAQQAKEVDPWQPR